MSRNQLKIELLLEDLFFNNLSEECPISEQVWQNWFKKWFNELNPAIPNSEYYEVSLRLTDDAGIKSLNSQFRSLNKPTDVLSFASLEVNTPLPENIKDLYLGDIIISCLLYTSPSPRDS